MTPVHKKDKKMTDPIADYLTRVRNAYLAGKNPQTKTAAIKKIERVSTPGLRKYTDVENMPRVLNGLGIAILSTSKGVITDKEAKELNVGGEVLCIVY